MLEQTREILSNYEEKLVKSTKEYEHLIKFNCSLPKIQYKDAIIIKDCYYFIDNQDNFWLQTSICEELEFSIENKRKYMDITAKEQRLFSLISKEDVVVLRADVRFLIEIILSNKRKGTPRKNFLLGNESINIQLKEDSDIKSVSFGGLKV